ncbi:unnamed protein product [Sphagnum jensenii]|uniref:Uncharacterized protein n=1 Tax=Sphagnum jensenii TaxID=128206 RepID=A0ABP1BCZ6_9BRYO
MRKASTVCGIHHTLIIHPEHVSASTHKFQDHTLNFSFPSGTFWQQPVTMTGKFSTKSCLTRAAARASGSLRPRLVAASYGSVRAQPEAFATGS